MKKLSFVLSLFFVLSTNVQAQLGSSKTSITKTDDHGTTTITKEYDADGNINRYDSIFVPHKQQTRTMLESFDWDSVGTFSKKGLKNFDEMMEKFFSDDNFSKIQSEIQHHFKNLPSWEDIRKRFLPKKDLSQQNNEQTITTIDG